LDEISSDRKQELLDIYKSYIPYRRLYSSIENASGLLEDLLEQVRTIQTRLKELLTKEDKNSHGFLEEITMFCYCIETLLRHVKPMSPLIPNSTGSDLNFNLLIILTMLKDPEVPRQLKLSLLTLLLKDPTVPEELKLLLLLPLQKS